MPESVPEKDRFAIIENNQDCGNQMCHKLVNGPKVEREELKS